MDGVEPVRSGSTSADADADAIGAGEDLLASVESVTPCAESRGHFLGSSLSKPGVTGATVGSAAAAVGTGPGIGWAHCVSPVAALW